MISRREKIKKQFNTARESVFYATLEVLTDKSLHLGSREIERIVKTYKDLPEPYNNYSPPGPSSLVTLDMKRDKSLSRRSSVSSENSRTNSVENKVKLKANDSVGKKTIDSSKSISETPKSRKSRHVSKTEDSEKIDNKESCDTKTEVTESLPNTVQVKDSGTNDGPLVNTSIASFTADNLTLVQSEPEMADTKPVKRKRGRPSLNKHLKDSKVEHVADSSGDEMADNDITSRKVRTRSSLPEIVSEVDCKDFIDIDKIKVEQTETESLAESTETRSKKSDKRERRYSAVVKLTDLEKEGLVSKFPSAHNVSNHVKAELSGYLKNNKLVVSNKLRQKVTNALLNGKRQSRFGKNIIIDRSQKKIDTFFMKSPPCDPDSPKSPAKAVSRVLNELSPTRDRHEANSIERAANSDLKISDLHVRRKSGNSSRSSPSLTSMEKCVDKNHSSTPESQIIRTRYDSDNVHSVKDRLFESGSKRITRSSRESTPESTTSSVRSFNSYKCARQETSRIRTRSNTPMSVTKDSDESESENIFTETRRSRR